MKPVAEIKVALLQFMAVDKFGKYGHLQPAVENSTKEDRALINKEFDRCCSELLRYLETKEANDAGLIAISRQTLERIEDAELDTEDREFCYELMHVLEEILGVQFERMSISDGEKMLEQLKKLAEKAGIDLDQLLPPKP